MVRAARSEISTGIDNGISKLMTPQKFECLVDDVTLAYPTEVPCGVGRWAVIHRTIKIGCGIQCTQQDVDLGHRWRALAQPRDIVKTPEAHQLRQSRLEQSAG